MEGNVYEYTIEDKVFNGTVEFKKVTKRIKGWKQQYEFIELSTKVHVLDKGYRKVLPPYLKSDSDGNLEVDKKDWLKNEWDGESTLRCFMVNRLVIADYFKVGNAVEGELKGKAQEFFIDGEEDVCNFEKYFGMSYTKLIDVMEQFSYERETGDIYSLNFHEI